MDGVGVGNTAESGGEEEDEDEEDEDEDIEVMMAKELQGIRGPGRGDGGEEAAREKKLFVSVKLDTPCGTISLYWRL